MLERALKFLALLRHPHILPVGAVAIATPQRSEGVGKGGADDDEQEEELDSKGVLKAASAAVYINVALSKWQMNAINQRGEREPAHSQFCFEDK